MDEKNTRVENPNAKDPFVRLDKCGAIINNIDYDSNGRLTYMPYGGVEEGKNNKIISTPDPHTVALAYTSWCVDVLNNSIFNLPVEVTNEFAESALTNMDYTISNRLKIEIGVAAVTIFNASTRALILPYIIDPEKEEAAYRSIKQLGILPLNNMFIKDNDNAEYMHNPRSITYNDYCVNVNDVVVKSSRIISFAASDVANMVTSYIYNCLFNMNLTKFADDSIANLGIDRSMVSPDNDLPYVASVLYESAYNDTGKITEIIELLVNHSYYVFGKYYTEIVNKIQKPVLEDKSSQNPSINIKPRNIPNYRNTQFRADDFPPEFMNEF